MLKRMYVCRSKALNIDWDIFCNVYIT
jgi:hypothetical protein